MKKSREYTWHRYRLSSLLGHGLKRHIVLKILVQCCEKAERIKTDQHYQHLIKLASDIEKLFPYPDPYCNRIYQLARHYLIEDALESALKTAKAKQQYKEECRLRRIGHAKNS